MGENTSKPIVELVKAGSNVLGQFYQDLAQPSVRALGQALGTVFELCPTSLLSIKIWTEKRKINFKKRLNEYAKKIEDIPEDKRCEVDTQIGTPIVERLTYTTNDQIADLFTTLLANASNINTMNNVHPAFVQIVSELCPDEALIIKYLYEQKKICYVKHIRYIGYVFDSITEKINLSTPQSKDMYFSHLIVLGIIAENQRSYTDFSPSNKAINTEYKKLELKIEELIKNSNIQIKETTGYDLLSFFKEFEHPHTYNRGFYCLTQFGEFFAKACLS